MDQSLVSRPRRKVLPRGGAVVLLAAAACCFAPLPSARAQQPVISASFVQSGGFFNYNFTVRNLTAFTLADVNVSVGASPVTNTFAPTGFLNVYDPGNGLVDFLADNDNATTQDFFAGTTVSGFLLRTATNLNGAAFNALDEQDNRFNGTVTTFAAPEPGTLGLLAFGAVPAAAILARRRRRRFVCAPLKG